jgi:hypothetical protein
LFLICDLSIYPFVLFFLLIYLGCCSQSAPNLIKKKYIPEIWKKYHSRF